MTFAQKIRAYKLGIAVSLILVVSIIAQVLSVLMAASNAYCHGASHNAHGAYCQTVYQDEYSALR